MDRVAIKGNGSLEYSKKIFQYFSNYTVKGVHDIDNFTQEAYYFIEGNKIAYSYNIPKNHIVITLD